MTLSMTNSFEEEFYNAIENGAKLPEPCKACQCISEWGCMMMCGEFQILDEPTPTPRISNIKVTARYIGHSFAQALIGATILMAIVTAYDATAARLANRRRR